MIKKTNQNTTLQVKHYIFQHSKLLSDDVLQQHRENYKHFTLHASLNVLSYLNACLCIYK